ncbi:MAG TPA: Gfo/Idh/MocA family oxidoreductase [Cyclobacteriaceae bacterium]|nr:Gfo/Idh/MocA family oxidoreductase [Cyclobacteriaceae bacterium]
MIATQKDALPKLGFLGVGWIGKHRMTSLASSDLSDEISIFDPSGPALQEALKAVPSAQVCGDYPSLLRKDVDGVVIASPSALHAKQAMEALEHGKAVFCQKPLGRNLAETKAVVNLAQKNNLLLAVDYSYRYCAGIAAIKELIEKEKLGRIYAVEAVFHNAYGPDKDWFYDQNLSGGGCLIDLGSHLTDLISYLFHPPSIEVCYAQLLSKGKPLRGLGDRVEDFAEAQLKSSTGISIRLACSWKLSVGKDADIYLKIFGTEGGACFYNVNGSFYDFQTDYYTQNSSQTLISPPDEWGGRAIQQWAKQLAVSNTFNPENFELIKSSALLEEIYKYSGI